MRSFLVFPVFLLPLVIGTAPPGQPPPPPPKSCIIEDHYFDKDIDKFLSNCKNNKEFSGKAIYLKNNEELISPILSKVTKMNQHFILNGSSWRTLDLRHLASLGDPNSFAPMPNVATVRLPFQAATLRSYATFGIYCMGIFNNRRLKSVKLSTGFALQGGLQVAGNPLLPKEDLDLLHSIADRFKHHDNYIQQPGECWFPDGVDDVEELEHCRYVLGNLEFNEGATGGIGKVKRRLESVQGCVYMENTDIVDATFLMGTVINCSTHSYIGYNRHLCHRPEDTFDSLHVANLNALIVWQENCKPFKLEKQPYTKGQPIDFNPYYEEPVPPVPHSLMLSLAIKYIFVLIIIFTIPFFIPLITETYERKVKPYWPFPTVPKKYVRVQTRYKKYRPPTPLEREAIERKKAEEKQRKEEEEQERVEELKKSSGSLEGASQMGAPPDEGAAEGAKEGGSKEGAAKEGASKEGGAKEGGTKEGGAAAGGASQMGKPNEQPK